MTKTTVLLSLFAATGLFPACESKKQAAPTNETTAVPVAAPDTRCFRQIAGRDTTTLRLVLTDSLVTGFLALRPYEKDRAEGELNGTRQGEAITADWQRGGEGVTQTYALTLTMTGDTVRWREGERVQQAGKWVLKTPDAGYEYVLTKTDCQP